MASFNFSQETQKIGFNLGINDRKFKWKGYIQYRYYKQSRSMMDNNNQLQTYSYVIVILMTFHLNLDYDTTLLYPYSAALKK